MALRPRTCILINCLESEVCFWMLLIWHTAVNPYKRLAPLCVITFNIMLIRARAVHLYNKPLCNQQRPYSFSFIHTVLSSYHNCRMQHKVIVNVILDPSFFHGTQKAFKLSSSRISTIQVVHAIHELYFKSSETFKNIVWGTDLNVSCLLKLLTSALAPFSTFTNNERNSNLWMNGYFVSELFQ